MAWFLIRHKTLLGPKKISSIKVFLLDDHAGIEDGGLCVLFSIEDMKGGWALCWS